MLSHDTELDWFLTPQERPPHGLGPQFRGTLPVYNSELTTLPPAAANQSNVLYLNTGDQRRESMGYMEVSDNA